MTNPTDEDIHGDSETISCDEFAVFECDAIYDDDSHQKQAASADKSAAAAS